MSYAYRCKNCGLVARQAVEPDGIASLIVCDTCGKEGRSEVYVPKNWYSVQLEDGDERDAPYIPPQHYCSRDCLKRGVNA